MDGAVQKRVVRFGMNMKVATWFNFRIDFSASILFSLYNVVVNQFYVPIAIRHGVTNVEVGLLTAAPAIGSLLSPLWAGLMGERSPMPFILWPNLVARLSITVLAFWLTPWMFVVVALFTNFLLAIQAPAYPAILTRMYPTVLRGRLMGYVRVAQCVFLVPLAYFVGSWFHVVGDRLPLVCASLTGALSMLVFTAVKQVEPSASEPAASRTQGVVHKRQHSLSRAVLHVRELTRMVRLTPGLGAFFVATTVTGFGNLVAAPLLQIYQIHVLDLSNLQIGVTRTVYYLFLLIAYFVLGWVIDKMSPKRALVAGMVAYALAPLLYVLFGSYLAVMAAYGLQGIGDAAWDIGLMSYVFRLAPGKEASVFGIHLLLFGLRGTIAPLLSTAVAAVFPISLLLTVASVLCFAGAYVLFQSKAADSGSRALSH